VSFIINYALLQEMKKHKKIILCSGLLLAVITTIGLFLLEKRAPAELSQKVVDSEEIDRLRSLGYLDFVPANKDDHRSGVVHKTNASYPGYNFFTNAFICMAVLTDADGNVVNYWHQQARCDRWDNTEFLDNGDVLVLGRIAVENRDPDSDRFLAKLSWQGRVIWRQMIPVHHDIEVTPSGDLLTLTKEHRTVTGVHNVRTIRDNRITLLNETGEVLEYASLYDMFRSAKDQVALTPVGAEVANEIDLFHANSVEWIRPEKLNTKRLSPLYSANNILFCSRHQDTVCIMNWPKKRIIWAWGQGILSGPHDANILANGNILLFDNGLARGWSRIIELDPVNKKIVWSYQAKKPEDFFTRGRGSDQRLANGNTLISESDKGHAFEVTPAGETVWEYFTPFKNADNERATIVRFYRFEPEKIQAIIRARGEGRKNPPLKLDTWKSRSSSTDAS
jgi:hypothetical protein